MLSKEDFNEKLKYINDNFELAKRCDVCKQKLFSVYSLLIEREEKSNG